MLKIAIGNQKGASGKTTLVCACQLWRGLRLHRRYLTPRIGSSKDIAHLQYMSDLESIGKIINTPAVGTKICSYDRMVVPDDGYILAEPGGDMYFCNERCFSKWAIQWATKPGLTEAQKSGEFVMTTPAGERRSFQNLSELARWAAANALGPTCSGLKTSAPVHLHNGPLKHHRQP